MVIKILFNFNHHLSSSICPKCRKHGTKHFQLFFEMMDDDEEAGGAIGLNKDTEFLSKQIRLLEWVKFI